MYGEVPDRYIVGAVSVADASRKSKILCVPEPPFGLIKHSNAKLEVPKPKSSEVGTVSWSSVPSNRIDAVPNFC